MGRTNILLLLPFLIALPQIAAPPDPQRAAHWREDFQVLTAALKAPGYRIAGGLATRGQKDFALLYPHFDSGVQELETDVPQIPDSEVLLRLMRLIASAHVAHNTVQIPLGMGFVVRLPFRFTWLADGLAVTAASQEYLSALGAHVVSIGGRSPEKLIEDLTPYISYENTTELHRQSVELMPAQGVLEHFKMIGPDGKVALDVEKPGGARETLHVTPQLGNVKKADLYEGLHIATPFYNSHPGAYYWHRYLPETQTLYIQYNRCQNDPKLKFADFAKQVLADADAHPVRQVVVDLRRNGGGDSRVIGPLKSGLGSRLKSLGKVYVFIGPDTFSSAVDNAEEMRRDLSATFVGSPSGGMPSGYGEVATVTLPNSKLVVRFTTKRWGPKEAGAPLSLIPDIPAPISLADLLASRDPALAAITSACCTGTSSAAPPNRP